MTREQPHRTPSEIASGRGWFDELAARAHEVASRDLFFLGIVVLTLVWLPSYLAFHSLDHWYMAFMLPAEVLTLFLVVLLENHNRRSEQALHRKLDEFAAVLAAMAETSDSEAVRQHAKELRAAVGLQDRESTDDS